MTIQPETRKRKLIHPWWTHLPPAAVLAVLIGYLIYASPLPASAPVHFSASGVVDAYGSPWSFLGVTIGFSVFFIGLSVFLDELWARQEKKKAFNWLSLLDDIVTGWMAGMGLGYLVALHNNADIFNFPWQYGLAAAGGALVLALILEKVRPYRAFRRRPEPREDTAFKEEIVRQLKDNAPFVYWENQNPAWVGLLSIMVPLIFTGSAVIVWLGEGWTLVGAFLGVGLILIGVLMMLFTFSGQRALLTRQSLAVRWGAIGLRVLNLNTAEIVTAELMEFSPLKDFGGYGMRYGRGMTAYYFRGNRGVKVTTIKGKQILVGSDHPERLLIVLELITGKKA
jgi:hypothetical protein